MDKHGYQVYLNLWPVNYSRQDLARRRRAIIHRGKLVVLSVMK
jgi:hypothetical protein